MIGVEEKKAKPLNAAARAAQIPVTPPRQRPPSATPPMPLRGNDSSVVRPLPPKGPAIVKIPDKPSRGSFDDSVVTVVSELPATIAAMDHSAVTVVSTLPASLAAGDAQHDEIDSAVAETASAAVPVDVDIDAPAEPAEPEEPVEPAPVVARPVDPAPLPKPVIRRKRSPGLFIALAGVGVAGAITAVLLLRGRGDSSKPSAHNVVPEVVKQAPPPEVEEAPPAPVIEKPVEIPVPEKPIVKKPIKRPVVKKPPAEKTDGTGKKWDPNALFPSK